MTSPATTEPATSTTSTTVTVTPVADPSTWVSCPTEVIATQGLQTTLSCERTFNDPGMTGQWTLVSAPSGFSLPVTAGFSLSFTPPQAGSYVIQFKAASGAAETVRSVQLTVQPPPNAAPGLSCPSALDGTTGREVLISCTATDDGLPAGSVLRAEWSAVSLAAPVSLSTPGTLSTRFVPATPGVYRLRLSVTDGDKSTSQDVVVTVALPPNAAPVINCPASLSGRVGQDVAISCTATDDGQPTGGTLVPAWTVVSSPGAANLTGSGSLNARIVPAAEGSYRLRLSVSDGQLASSSDVVVTVAPPPNVAPVVNCPATLTVQTGQEAVLSCTASDDGQPAGAVLQPAWTVTSAPAAVSLQGASTLTARFVPAVAGSYRLRLNVSDSLLASTADVLVTVQLPPNQAPVVSCPATQSGRVGEEVVLGCTASDDGQPVGVSLQPTWSVVSAPAAVSLSGASGLGLRFVPTAAGSYRLRLNVSDTLLSTAAEVVVNVSPPPNQAPTVSCPLSLAGQTGQAVSIGCTAADDGLPAGSVLSTSWSAVSVPTGFSLGSPSGTSLRLVPTVAGTYRLRLTASDGSLASVADVTVTVTDPPLQAPALSCPTALSGVASQSVSLSCTASAQGPAAGTPLTATWSVVSAPAAVSFTGGSSLNASFTPSVAGSYRLRLTVSDGRLASSADVTVTVDPPPNAAPVVNCPATVTGRTDQTVSLTCTATDDGLPAGSALSATWSVVSAPTAISLSGGNTVNPSFAAPVAGTYRLRLTVSDSQRSTSADVVVTVNLPPNQAPVVSCPATQTGTTQQAVSIGCSFSDDGQPLGAALTPAWTVVSGPAAVSLSGAGTATVGFVPTVAGTYRLRLTVSDSSLSAAADVVVTVSLPPNRAPQLTCPAVLTQTAGQEVVMTCAATDDGQPLGATLTPSWKLISGPADPGFSGNYTFSARFVPTVTGTYVWRLYVSDSELSGEADIVVTVTAPPNQAPVVNCPAAQTGRTDLQTQITCTATDDGQPQGSSLSYSWTVISAPTTVSLTAANTLSVRLSPTVVGTYRLRLTVSDGALSSTADVVLTVDPPPNVAPVVSCPATQAGFAGQAVTVVCTATDDGKPAGGSLSPSWSVLAAQDSFTISGETSFTVRLVPSAPGNYRLRLAVSDGELSTSADVSITVTAPPNVAPVVTCPATASGTANQALSVTCTASDDGQPAGASLAPTWSLVSSPAAVTLSGQNTLTAGFTPTVAGTYRLRLTVSDSLLATAADVVVTVAAPANKAPVVSCPATSVSGRVGTAMSVSCSASDDGLPAGSSLALNWSWVTAPAASALNGQGTGTVSFTPDVAGTYRLRLTASDGSLTTTADTDIVVAAASALRVQALGGSLTNGYGGQQSYRYPLWKLLLDQGANFDYVGTLTTTDGGTPTYPTYLGRTFDRDHEGHSGYTTADLANGLPTWLASYTPDVSLIHAGTNDLLFGGTSGPDNAIAGLTQMVAKLRAKNPNVRIVVAQIVPVDPTHPNWYLTGNYSSVPASVVTLNSRIPAWAASLSTTASPITVVDQYTGFDARADTIDGIHPNTSGEAKLANRWFAAIRGWF